MQKFNGAPAETLSGSLREHRNPRGRDLLQRITGFYDWQDLRRQNGLWPYARATENGPDRVCYGHDDRGQRIEGVNFSSQDYLSLSQHPVIKAAAIEAISEFGAHSAGSPAFVGNTSLSVQLEKRIADFLEMEEVLLFPTGWAAGFGVIKGLVRPDDNILIDALGHACLQEGAAAATKNVIPYRHNNVEDARRKLEKIRAKDPNNGILMVTESLFSMDSDTPDIAAFQALCDEFDATLMVDVAHDLGCLGADGRGHLGLQDMIGKVDLVMGSFSKTFASNGGFVASKARSTREYLRYFASPATFSNALSPAQAATVLKAFEIIDSIEGKRLRERLMINIEMLRHLLRMAGFETYGEPSAIVCVKMGTEALARLVARRLPQDGLIANLVEFPAVAKGQARFRLQVMANHTAKDITEAVRRLQVAYEGAKRELAEMEAGVELRRAVG